MEKRWEHKLVDYLKKAGEEIRAETQRLVEEVKDPAKHQKLREGLKELGTWAKKTAEEASQMVEGALKKAEGALERAAGRVSAGAPPSGRAPAPSPKAGAPTPQRRGAKAGAKRRAGAKTVGPKRRKTSPKRTP